MWVHQNPYFCRRYTQSDCSDLYLEIRQAMEKNFIEPPNRPVFKMVGMFHSTETEAVKKSA